MAGKTATKAPSNGKGKGTPLPAVMAAQVSVDIGQFLPNPYQPPSRLELPEEELERFGVSILEHGMIMTPLVRQTPAGGGGGRAIYEMGDGWIRLSAHHWLVAHGHPEFQEIRVDIREITNQKMADIIMEANSIRKDLNAIEEATLFQAYIKDFGVTESQLGKLHNHTQGQISNTIRLLELPEGVRVLVESGELLPTHARQLLRVNSAPAIQKGVLAECQKQNYSVNQLSDAIETQVWRNSQSLNPKSDYVHERPVFDVGECGDCEFKIRASRPWMGNKKEDRCLDEECWNKKNVAANQALIEAATKKLKADAKGRKVLTSDQLNYDQRNGLADARTKLDNPGECADCKKTALFVYSHNTGATPEEVCVDPVCYRKKQTRKTKDTNKVLREQDKELTRKLAPVFAEAHHTPRECLLVLAKHIIPMVNADGRADLLTMFPGFPKLGNGRMDIETVDTFLAEKTLDELLQVAVAAIITRQRRNESYGNMSAKLSPGLKRDMAIITGKEKEWKEAEIAFQKLNCEGCRSSKAAKVGTGEECCQWPDQRKPDAEGKCESRRDRPPEPVKEDAEPEPGEGEEAPAPGLVQV